MFKHSLIAALFCFASFQIDATIIETRHVEDAEVLIDQDTWVLVDLDNCLFEGAQAFGHLEYFHDHFHRLKESGLSEQEAIDIVYPYWSRAQSVCKVQPLEATFVPLLKRIQDQGIPVMGLTARWPLIAESTLRQVDSLGMDFRLTAPAHDDFEVPSPFPATHFKGVLFTNDMNTKISVFEVFLSMLQKSPKKVVFIDDNLKNLQLMEKLSEHGIEFFGIHYTAAKYAKPVYNREIAALQSKLLDQVLSNDAASLLMQHNLE